MWVQSLSRTQDQTSDWRRLQHSHAGEKGWRQSSCQYNLMRQYFYETVALALSTRVATVVNWVLNQSINSMIRKIQYRSDIA